MAFFIISVIVSIISAIICFKIAAGKGRNAVGYAILGFFLPLIGIIIIAVLKPVPGASPSTT